MKRMYVIALTFGLCVSAGAQTKPPTYSVDMCAVQQPTASKEYIHYCATHTDKFPACSESDPYGMMAAGQGGHGAYYEVLDCSWHSGKNPRDSMPARKTANGTSLLFSGTNTFTSTPAPAEIEAHKPTNLADGVSSSGSLVQPQPKKAEDTPHDWTKAPIGFRDASTFTVTPEFTDSVSVQSKDGIRVDRMSDEEFAKIQVARKALADVLAGIEKAHSVDLTEGRMITVNSYAQCPEDSFPAVTSSSEGCYVKHKPDTVQYFGPFMVITDGGK